MKITKETINRLENKVVPYNHHAKRAAIGKASLEEKAYMDSLYSELVEMFGILTDLGFKVEETYKLIERYETIITQIKIDNEVIWEA